MSVSKKKQSPFRAALLSLSFAAAALVNPHIFAVTPAHSHSTEQSTRIVACLARFFGPVQTVYFLDHLRTDPTAKPAEDPVFASIVQHNGDLFLTKDGAPKTYQEIYKQFSRLCCKPATPSTSSRPRSTP
jgi:hypothetical protein